jgi:hypothetical protein
VPVKFYTYAPGKGKGAIKLLPGQTLAFKPGSGYYAKVGAAPAPYPGGGPAEPKSGAGGNPYAPQVIVRPRAQTPVVPAPTPPVDPYGALTPAQIDAQASALAQAGLTPEQQAAQRQKDAADAQALADEGAIKDFSLAAGQIMGEIPGQISSAYDTAGKAVGDMGTGVGGQIGADLAAKQAAADDFSASQGQSGGTSANGQEGNVVGMLGGVIPGQSLEEEGAARSAAAALDVKIPLNAGREELAARMAKAKTDDDNYAQQLIDIAAKYPDLKAQALQQLNQYELDKATYRENTKVSDANIADQKAQTALQTRAEIANEKAAGITASTNAATLNYKWASLQFQSDKAVAAAKAAAAKGKRIDTSASRLMGHLVYMDGTEDKSIKVKQTAGTASDPTVKAQYNKAKSVQKARSDSFKAAAKTFGKPTLNKNQGLLGGKGKYIADPSQKYGVPGGVFPPVGSGGVATTNDPRRAARTGGASSYAEAQAQVWASIAGDSLMSRYAMSKEQVMAIVNRSLAAAGWRK